MAIERTKQQTACDGVRTAWQSDAFTQILHQQVATKFSMDGVVSVDDPTEASVVLQEAHVVKTVKSTQDTEVTQKRFGMIAGTMDGVKKQWRPVHAI